ncbi:TniQ family protein [Paenibacillus sp. BJ-4]|uniref:TniQ family protein n=1 Tax=Paenibacillus sp. BJ-4 TaxID=2878097 RepID=UPI001CF0A78E|nr:TniQ family protein [Paenibacillus sp. BJ-4]
MFLIRLKPYPGESLLSFLNRYASINGISLLGFWGYVKNKRFGTPQFNDLYLIENTPTSTLDVKLLSELTNLSIQTLLSMTHYYAQSKFSHSKKIVYSRFMRGLVRDVLYFCPQCLATKNYIRLKWKIVGVDICLEHLTFLSTCCLNCSYPIPLKELEHTNCCTKCNASLDVGIGMKVTDLEELVHQQQWLSNQWDVLFSNGEEYCSPVKVAQKLIFVLNERNSTIDMQTLTVFCDRNGINLQYLLQFARNTLKQKRSVHLQYLLKILYLCKVDLPTFFLIKPTSGFVEQLSSGDPQETKAKCLAPWCRSYKKAGSLKKRGTKFKHLKNGEIRKNYLFCMECGCNYYFDETGKQVETEEFIRSFPYIKDCISANDLVLQLKLPLTKCKRIIAYFRTRLDFLDGHVDPRLLNRVQVALESNTGFNQIKASRCWGSLDEFLMYRYHIDVLRTRISSQRKAKQRIDYDLKWSKLTNTTKKLLKMDVNISLTNISRMIGMSSTTLLNWEAGYNHYLELKMLQQQKRLTIKINNLYIGIDDYVSQFKEKRMLAKDIYRYLGIKQSYLLSIAPEVTKYITEQKNAYNRNFMKKKYLMKQENRFKKTN